jgi:hypothetical protein
MALFFLDYLASIPADETRTSSVSTSFSGFAVRF